MLLFIIISIILIAIDQLTKYIATIKLSTPIPIIEDILHLQYAENTGSAFSMFNDIPWFRWVFIILAVFVCSLIFYINLTKKYDTKLFYISSILIVSGAIGNVIDRIINGYVVDFIYFKIINFPIFNFADICLTIGVIILFIEFIFFDRNKKKINTEGIESNAEDSSIGTNEE